MTLRGFFLLVGLSTLCACLLGVACAVRWHDPYTLGFCGGGLLLSGFYLRCISLAVR